MTLVLMAMGFAMVGVFLPITIYFQSVLGLSAFDAGIAIAPMALVMMLFSGVVAPLAARFGKYILMAGLTLFAIGIAYIAWRVQVDASRWSLVPGLVLGGLGLSGVWTPVYSLATRDLQPRLAGVASGVLSTVQELGAVIGSAAIGALLQNRLATGLHDHAIGYASQLPDPFRARFVDGFSQAASRGLEVGRGQTGGSLQLPAGIPAQVVQQLQRLAHAVFTQSFVDAMRPSMALGIVVVVVAAVGVFGVRARATRAEPVAGDQAYQQVAPVA
jgi:MFS family permease